MPRGDQLTRPMAAAPVPGMLGYRPRRPRHGEGVFLEARAPEPGEARVVRGPARADMVGRRHPRSEAMLGFGAPAEVLARDRPARHLAERERSAGGGPPSRPEMGQTIAHRG